MALTAPVAEHVVSMSSDGRILSQGPPSTATLAKGSDFSSDNEKDTIDEEQSAEGGGDTKKASDGKLIATEEIAEGRVGWRACEPSLFTCCSLAY